ncbi:MAG: recombinase family protein, partial [Streptomycetaceae bacterium]|nr:recombinase family protein [Streptomycetaceae bacterium]
MLTTEYDGCGMCLVGARRLSRKTGTTNSPETQLNHIITVAHLAGGHIIAWADDLESVSGATDPMWRTGLGPWLRGEAGPYDGIASSAVDRIGREVLDALEVKKLLTSQGRKIITHCHEGGVWDFDAPGAEDEWMMKAWLAQGELRAIQRRNRNETLRARTAGDPKQKPSYGYRFVRLHPTAKIDHVEIDPVAAEIIRDVAERILTDETGKITVATEAARLTRAGVPSPNDHRAIMYGRAAQGRPWTPKALKSMLVSEAALGFLMHGGRPVLGDQGRPKRLADPLWDAATRDALIAKTAPKRTRTAQAPHSVNLLAGLAFCGICGARLYIAGRSGPTM